MPRIQEGSLNWAVALVLAAAAAVVGYVLLHNHSSAEAATAHAAKSKFKLVQQNFPFSAGQANDPQRLEVRCPKGTRPLGGGLIGSPPVAGDGVGIYPTSSERLGVQNGWHVTATLFNDTTAPTAPRSAALQAFCVKLKGDLKPAQSTVLVSPGESVSTQASCDKGRKAISGGYLSTQFFPGKGVYATESRLISDTTWQATAFGVITGKGGSLTALAYCVGSKKPILREQTGTANAPFKGTATATTPACSKSQPLVVGGFAGPLASGALLFFDPSATGNAWSTSAVGVLGGGDFTAYGYCLLTTKISKGNKGGHPEITTVPIVESSFTEPPSPHGNSFAITVQGSSTGKLRGSPSTAAPVTKCLQGRPTLITASYKTPTVAGPAGSLNTTSDSSGKFSTSMQINMPDHLDQPVQLSVSASFNTNVNKKVGGKKVTCQPGGQLHPNFVTLGP